MEESLPKTRDYAGMCAMGLLAGPTSTMLWLGRWEYAVGYYLASALAGIVFFALPSLGFVKPTPIYNLDLTLFSMVQFPVTVIGLIHAFRLNKAVSTRPIYARWYIAILVPILLSLAIAFIVKIFLVQSFTNPSASSEPNLMVGDYFLVSKTAYNGRGPQRGDLAVFTLPSNPNIDYIKRVVGMPGDKIQMIGGVLNINGVPVKIDEVQVAPYLMGDDGEKKFYRETLPNGRSYVIGDMGNTQVDNTDIYEIPEGQYFTVGDNRDNSLDSRFIDKFGYVPRGNFVGPVVYRFWNSHGLPLIGRPEETYPKE